MQKPKTEDEYLLEKQASSHGGNGKMVSGNGFSSLGQAMEADRTKRRMTIHKWSTKARISYTTYLKLVNGGTNKILIRHAVKSSIMKMLKVDEAFIDQFKNITWRNTNQHSLVNKKSKPTLAARKVDYGIMGGPKEIVLDLDGWKEQVEENIARQSDNFQAVAAAFNEMNAKVNLHEVRINSLHSDLVELQNALHIALKNQEEMLVLCKENASLESRISEVHSKLVDVVDQLSKKANRWW